MKTSIKLEVFIEINIPDGFETEEEYYDFIEKQCSNAEVEVTGMNGKIYDVQCKAGDTFEVYQWEAKLSRALHKKMTLDKNRKEH